MDRPWDIIDEIQGSVGHIRSLKHAKHGTAGYYGEYYRDAIRGPAKALFAATGQSPDEVVDSLRESRALRRDATVDDLWDAIKAAADARRAFARRESPEVQQQRFTKALTKRSKARCKRLMPVNSLAIGDGFKFDGDSFAVQDVDPDTGETIIVDGKRFGRQAIPDGAVLPVDTECVRKPKKPLGAPRIPKAAVRRLGGLITARRQKLAQRPRRARATPKRALRRQPKPKAVKPTRATPRARRVRFVAIRQGRLIQVLRLAGCAIAKVGTFTQKSLRQWAAKRNIRLK